MKRLTKADYAVLAFVLLSIIFVAMTSGGMGGLNPVSVILVCALLLMLVVLFAAVSQSGLRYYVLRLAEWAAPGTANRVLQRFTIVRATTWIGVAAAADLFMIGFTAAAEKVGAGGVAAIGQGLSVFGPALAIVFALVLHFRANSSRSLKYFLMIGASTLHAAVFLRAVVRNEGGSLDEELGAAVLGPMVLLFLLLIAAPILSSRRASFLAHRATHLPLWIVAALAVVPYISLAWHPLVFAFGIFQAFLAVRFLGTAKVSDHPILFFRGFANKRADAVLGRIVGPAAAPLGVLRILVHRKQPVSEIGALTGALHLPQLDQVPDKTWKEHVEKLLQSCLCVILVRDGESEGLAWELEQTLAMVGASGLIVLSSDAATELPAAGGAQSPTFLRFSLDDRAEVKKVRSDLARWLRAAVARPGAPHARAERISPVAVRS